MMYDANDSCRLPSVRPRLFTSDADLMSFPPNTSQGAHCIFFHFVSSSPVKMTPGITALIFCTLWAAGKVNIYKDENTHRHNEENNNTCFKIIWKKCKDLTYIKVV